MKNKILIGFASMVLALAIGITYKTVTNQSNNYLGMNLEALADSEYLIDGACGNWSNDCIIVCPRCGEMYYSVGRGPWIGTFVCSCGYSCGMN